VTEVAILVPVLRRPQNVRPLLESIANTTPTAHVVFIADPDDGAEIEEIKVWQGSLEALYGDLTISLLTDGGNYAEKINLACLVSDEPLIFLGADDLRFRDGWLDAAKEKIDGGAHVVGVNDLLPRKRHHATHFLMTRDYALRPTIDGGMGPLHTGYSHSFVDDELIGTALRREVYVYAPRAYVEHLHPQGKSAPDDATYRKGRRNFARDKELFAERATRWT
jgi:hypothetical protein